MNLSKLSLSIVLALGSPLAAASAADSEIFNSSEEAQTLDPVWVRGTRPDSPVTVGGKLELSAKDTPRSVTTIDRKRLDEEQTTSISRVVERATGVYVRDQGDLDDGPMFYSRGFAMSGSENGIPFDTTYYGAGLDTSLYERVEILRGPDGLMQGQGQLGGTVNLVRKRPTAFTQRSFEIGAGQWDAFRSLVDLSGRLRQDGRVRGRTVLTGDRRNSWLPHVGNEKAQGYAIVEIDAGDATTLSFHAQAQSSNVNPNFGALYDGERYTPRDQYAGASWSKFNFNRTDAGLGVKHRFNEHLRLNAQVDYRNYDDKKRFAFHNPHPNFANTGRSALINRATWFEGDQWTGDVHLTGEFKAFGGAHEFVVGGNVERFDFDNWTRNAPAVGLWEFGNPDVPYVELDRPAPRSTRIVQAGVYAQGRFELAQQWHLHLGSRLSRYRSHTTNNGITAPNYDESGVFTPYGALVWTVSPRVNVYASYADIFRPQSFGTDDASGELLPPLVGRQVEVGSKIGFVDDRVLLNLSVFDAQDRNRAIQDPVDPAARIAAGEVESRGAEIELTGQITPSWNATAGYTYTQTRFATGYGSQEGTNFNGFSPRQSFKLWTTYTLETAGVMNGWSAGVGARAFSSSELAVAAPYVFTARQPRYAMMDVRLAAPVSRTGELALNINNVFDREYVSAPNIRAFYGSPRQAELRYTLRW